MTQASDFTDGGVRRFRTDDLPLKDRVDRWRDECARTMLRVDMAPMADQPFRCAAEIRALPRLGIMSLTTSPNRLTRSRSMVADGNDDLIFVIPLQGGATISRREREITLDADTASLVASNEPMSTLVPVSSRFLSLAVPAPLLRPLIPRVDVAALPAVSSRSEAVRLLVAYVGHLRDCTLSTPEIRHLAVSHIHDLITLAVGATRDAAELAGRRGLRAARLDAVKADVLANLGSADLSLDQVAVRHGITPRYVRMLFEGEGTSFSAFVLDRRLEMARRMLADPGRAGRTVGAVAFDCGFGDLSYFNRTFRRRFGATPSDVRWQADRG